MWPKSEGMEKGIPCKLKLKENQVAILISDKINFKINIVTRDKGGHHVMTEVNQEEDKTIVNIYVPKYEHLNM